MANTYVAIATVTVGSGGAASIDFSSIPATYTDLALLVSARSARATGGADTLYLKINTVTTNRTSRTLEGDGATASSGNYTDGFIGNLPQNTAGWTANTFANTLVYIPNYAGSTNKSFSVDTVTETNATTAYSHLFAGLWSQTTAINQLTLITGTSNNFVEYSTATLYGIKNS